MLHVTIWETSLTVGSLSDTFGSVTTGCRNNSCFFLSTCYIQQIKFREIDSIICMLRCLIVKSWLASLGHIHTCRHANSCQHVRHILSSLVREEVELTTHSHMNTYIGEDLLTPS